MFAELTLLQLHLVSIYYITYLKNIIWKLLQKKTKVFGFVATDHLRAKVIIIDETLEQVSQFTYLGCSMSSNDVESELANFLQLIETIKRTIFKKVRTESILKICYTLVLPTVLYGSENWTLNSFTKTKN